MLPERHLLCLVEFTIEFATNFIQQILLGDHFPQQILLGDHFPFLILKGQDPLLTMFKFDDKEKLSSNYTTFMRIT
jgi:hypothetical protein